MHPKDFFLANKTAVTKQTCFVLMPFREDFTPIYEAIRSAVEGPELNYSCTRADELLGGGAILGNILGGIASNETIIADLTTRNPNVFYELGIAHTTKDQKQVIVLTQSMEDVPVDLRHLFCVLYEASQEGLVALQRQVLDSIRAVTPAGLRFTVSQGESRTFPQRLAGPDLQLYEFDVGPLITGLETAEFRLAVRRCSVDAPDEVVSASTYRVESPGSIEIPFLGWMLNLDAIIHDRAHFCLCRPE